MGEGAATMPNTVDKWVTTATIYDPERRQLWEKIFPGAVVPIVSIIPSAVNVPERGATTAYMLDLVVLTDDQREGVCRILAERFNIPIAEVREDLWMGVPIVTDGVRVQTVDQGHFFSLIDDGKPNDEDEESEP
jgi:hypothetical protein